MNVYIKETLDPYLQASLELLRLVPRRDPLAAVRAKANFLAELEVMFESDRSPQPGFFTNPARWLDSLKIRIKKPLVLSNSTPRTAVSLASILLIVVVLLFGWVGFTARAAETSLPGDTLYSFKTGMEQVQISLAGDLDKQAGLYLEFASHRLHEIDKLVDSGRYQKAVSLSAKFRFNIQKALEITNNLAKVDPARAAQRQIKNNSQLANFTVQLNELLVKLPPSFQPAFNNILPPIQPGIPTPVTPGETQTPTPSIEQDAPPGENTNQQNNTNDDTDTGNNQGSDNGSEKEQEPGKSTEFDSEAGSQEETSANKDRDSVESSHEEYRNENATPE